MTSSNSKLKGLFNHSMVYWVGTMVSKMIGFFMIPLYTRFLLPEDYGTLELVALTADVIAILVGAQISTAVFKFYHDENNEVSKKSIISTSIIGLAVLSGVFLLILGLNAEIISELIFGHSNHAILFQLMFLGYFFSIVEEVPMAYLRILDKSKLFVLITILQLLLMIGLNVYFVAVLEYGVFGILLGTMIAFGVTCLVLLWQTIKMTGTRVVIERLIDMLRYSIPLIPAALGMFVIHFSDRFFLNHYAPLSDVGIYSLAYKFGFLITPLVVRPFYMIWQSKMFEFYDDKNREELYNKIMAIFLFAIAAGYLLVSAFIDEILILMATEKYYSAALYVPLIAGAYVLNGANQIFLAPLYAEKKTKRIGMINGAAAIVNIILNIILIKAYGIMGAALATLLSFMFITIYTVIESTKVSHLRWEWVKYSKLLVIVMLAITLISLISINSILLSILLKTMILLFSLFVLFLSGYFDKEQIDYLKRVIVRGGNKA